MYLIISLVVLFIISEMNFMRAMHLKKKSLVVLFIMSEMNFMRAMHLKKKNHS